MRDLRTGAHNLVVIGSSTGGPAALRLVLGGLPKLDAAVVIVQHMPSFINASLCATLDRVTDMDVRVASDGEHLRPGVVYVAPSEVHATLRRNRSLCLAPGAPVNYCCPSIDVTMKSVCRETDGCLIGIVLTGMGSDGAEGLTHMKDVGAMTFAQEGNTCAVNGMPKAAIDAGGAEYVLAPTEIRDMLVDVLGGRVVERV